ncbi:unnamed protein product [Rotaria sp. Silwood1]|nr:unnamed protein product [Rotaria sp. Silwood1]CAF3701615.1 unnamed protein product [Rotaria sp. Silwood1]CAF3713311.1 unnamed protein product [Rotaria sp. Silwood1]CAF3782892.1 unnamed protein product [Rotaria sp. Silwood1]CAF4615534.1 unnamed protein product [Rotaria sp. Silwood1]
MFRNVTSAQEAIVHRQSENSLSNEKNQIKLIKDVQSDDIAQKYSTLKIKWFHQREQLIENLKYLEKHNAYSHEIQHVKNLIECLNELIENGEMTKNCQKLINDMNNNIHVLPDTYSLAKKPLGDKMIRLPRHISKTTTNISHSLKNLSSEILHIQRSNEKLSKQIDLYVNPIVKQIDKTFDNDEITTSNISTEKIKSGIQFYVVAEQFRHQTDINTRKKHYLSSSIIE